MLDSSIKMVGVGNALLVKSVEKSLFEISDDISGIEVLLLSSSLGLFGGAAVVSGVDGGTCGSWVKQLVKGRCHLYQLC